MNNYSKEDFFWANENPTVRKYTNTMKIIVGIAVLISVIALILIIIAVSFSNFRLILYAMFLLPILFFLIPIYKNTHKKRDSYVDQILSLRKTEISNSDEVDEQISSEELEIIVSQKKTEEKTNTTKDYIKQEVHINTIVRKYKTYNLINFFYNLFLCAALLSTLLPFFNVLVIEDVSILKFFSEYGFLGKNTDVGKTFYGSVLESFINAKTNIGFIDDNIKATYVIKEIWRVLYTFSLFGVVLGVIFSLIPTIFDITNVEQKVRRSTHSVFEDKTSKKRIEKGTVGGFVLTTIVFPFIIILAYFPFAFGKYLNQESMGMISMNDYTVLLPATLFIISVVLFILSIVYYIKEKKDIIECMIAKKTSKNCTKRKPLPKQTTCAKRVFRSEQTERIVQRRGCRKLIITICDSRFFTANIDLNKKNRRIARFFVLYGNFKQRTCG